MVSWPRSNPACRLVACGSRGSGADRFLAGRVVAKNGIASSHARAGCAGDHHANGIEARWRQGPGGIAAMLAGDLAYQGEP